jgi:hypothetical protein
MSTKTAPINAAEARELAERWEREEAELADRKAAARHNAEVEHWQAEYDRTDLRSERDKLDAEWRAVGEKPDATLDQLFTAWRGVCVAAARAFAVRNLGAQRADTIDPPKRTYNAIGVDVTLTSRPRAPKDHYASWTFNDALTQHYQAIADAAADADIDEAEAGAVKAADDAEAAVS